MLALLSTCRKNVSSIKHILAQLEYLAEIQSAANANRVDSVESLAMSASTDISPHRSFSILPNFLLLPVAFRSSNNLEQMLTVVPVWAEGRHLE